MARTPSLNAIRSFEAAARLLSFTAAAQELNVTQGAVSRIVQALEQELGVTLFTRNGRFIAVTPAGAAYHAEISEALQRIAAASDRVRRSAVDTALSVSVNSGFATRWLVPRLPEFQRRNPDVQVNILGSETDERGGSGQAHVAIRFGAPPWHGSVATRLALNAALGVVASPKLLVTVKARKPADLLGRPLLAYTGASRDLWKDYFAHYQAPEPDLRQAPRFYQMMMLVEAALSGLGFALVPLFLVAQELRDGRLVQPFPETFAGNRGYFITHQQGADREHKVQVFKKWLLAKARQGDPPVMPIASRRGRKVPERS